MAELSGPVYKAGLDKWESGAQPGALSIATVSHAAAPIRDKIDLILGEDELPAAPVRPPMLYVGIGASAGGLEALRDFFDHMSADSGAAFVVVQHLSPDFESLMGELLAHNTRMPVVRIVDGVEVLANTLYLAPPEKNVSLVGGCLYLSELLPQGGVNLPVDHFFRSLANDARHRAVGIVLSGTGNDGSRGVRLIKEAGGVILVQDRRSARFDGMPLGAVRAGAADVVLPPEELALYLTTFSMNTLVRGVRSTLRVADYHEEAALRLIFELLKSRCSVDFTQYDKTIVMRRLQRRIGVSQVQKKHDYLNILQSKPEEVETLCRELLNPATGFFRDETAWDALTARCVRPLIERSVDGAELHFWVAGCSTGEEAYSLAMITDEVLQELGKHLTIRITATDVDPLSIHRADTARYSDEIAHDVSCERLVRHFERVGGEYGVRHDIRQMVEFSVKNMIDESDMTDVDLITCRHVLDLFQPDTAKKVLTEFHASLRRGACIFVAPCDSLDGLESRFRAMSECRHVHEKLDEGLLCASAISAHDEGKSASGIGAVSHLLRNYRTRAMAKVRLLVVDSSESDRRLIRDHASHIKSMSVETIEAETVQRALQALKEDVVDVCLVEYGLGFETADELSRQIAEHETPLPVIVMWQARRPELEGRMGDDRLVHYLDKSEMSDSSLERSIRHALNPGSENAASSSNS